MANRGQIPKGIKFSSMKITMWSNYRKVVDDKLFKINTVSLRDKRKGERNTSITSKSYT